VADKLITPPAVEPVTADDILSKLGLQSGDVASNDLSLMVAAARSWCETYTGRAFIAQTWETRLDKFPDALMCPRPPVMYVASLKYVDTAGALQVIDPQDYFVDEWRSPGWVMPAYGAAWPTPRDEANAVRLQTVCGYGAAGEDVPEPIRHAIVLIVGMTLRGQSGQEASLYPAMIPRAAKELLQPYRLMGV